MRLSESKAVKPLTEREVKEAEIRARQREVWGGVAGVVAIAVVLCTVTVGIAAATFSKADPAAAARALQFGQCYNSDRTNCVIDGDTIYAGGEKLQIAGIEAPQIQSPRCDAERNRGIEAATRLAALLNSGKVTVSGTFRDDAGRSVRKVKVDGQDVAGTMIDASLARAPGDSSTDWCA